MWPNAEATGGEILVTEEVSEAAGDEDELAFGEPREVELKGLPGTHVLRALEWREA